jgi:serine/threonine-protein kinase
MIGETFLGRYRAEHLLGEGGMGRVFLGRQLDDGREVVIKVMHDRFANDLRFRQAFEREMTLMMRFRHPYAVALYDASLEDGVSPCIVMEYVPGVNLAQLVEHHGRLPALRVGMLLGQLGQVLQSAHDNGIVHRDLTPVNIMVMNPDTNQETVKVMDFGLARIGAGPYIPLEKLTGKAQSIGGGTPDYVSPEQVRGEEVDHRGDLYAVGVLLFKVLTGYLPFESATTTEEILRAHLQASPPRFAELGAGSVVPPDIETVVRACLAKFPRERPQSALELVSRYEKALGRPIITGEVATGSMLPAATAHQHDDPRTVMDHLEAWMPEPIAVVKLRGFAHDMGGEFIDSEPGLIRFRLPDPTCPVETAPKGILSLLNLGKKARAAIEHILVELRMEKISSAGAGLLHMTVMMKPQERLQRVGDSVWRDGCHRLCRDLRAYLISR